MNASADTDHGAHGPCFGDADLQRIFTRFSGYAHVAFAVSGGPDSTALTLLARRWLDAAPESAPQITVLTVDHRLRDTSAAEAAWVAHLAARLGFPHRILAWEGAKPKTGVQAAARSARYDLMTSFCRGRAIPAIATAHTLDDQAETFVMRLARGSGLDGLAAMAVKSRRSGIDLLRPLLGVTRARLIDFLRAEGQDWIEDPSNRDKTYERVRVRGALAAAEKLGLARDSLALSAARLGRARDALEQMTAEFLAANLTVHCEGFGEMPLDTLLLAPEDVALRALARITLAFGGRAAPPQLAKIEAAYKKLGRHPRTVTLGGCEIGLHGDRLTVAREFGRMDRSTHPLSPGERLLWDGRFTVSLAATAAQPAFLLPLGPDGLRALKAAKGRLGPMPRATALTLPSLWRNSALCFVPFVSFAAAKPPGWVAEAGAEFANAPLLFAPLSSSGNGCEIRSK